jgi:phytol kinase
VIVGTWEVAGRLKRAGRIREGDSRKLNHITCLTAGAVLFGWLPEAVARPSCYVGMGVPFCLLLLVCAFRDRWAVRNMFYGYARASDAPHEAFHVWFSWLVSIAGLVGIDQVFGDMTITRTACLVLGLADGVAEPVGVRWGRNKYRVPAVTGGAPAHRSVEGSAAVFVTTFAVVFWTWAPATAGLALVVAAVVTVVEAFSPHGLDNLSIPVAVGGILAGSGGV